MKRIIFYNILIIMALLASCRKVDLEPVDGDPVFTAEAKFDGGAHGWQAGVDDYYMFSSFEKDEFDVHIFSGSFAKKDSTGGEVFTLRIRDFEQVAQGLPNVEGALEPGRDFGFVTQMGIDTIWVAVEKSFWDAQFNASNCIYPAGSQPSFEWNFGDGFGETTTIDTISHWYDSIPNGIPVRLDLKTSNNACSAYIIRNLDATGNAQNCDLDLEVQYDPINSDSNIQIIAQAIGFQAFNYQWHDFSTDSLFELNIQNAGPVNLSVTVTGSSGCTVIGGISTTLTPGAVPQICVAKYNYSIDFLPNVFVLEIDTIIVGDSLQFSKITIEYTNADGFEYRSDRQTQAPSAYFKILEMDDYDDNEKGEKTKKITLEFTCRLWDVAENFIDVTEGKAVIAVAYP